MELRETPKMLVHYGENKFSLQNISKEDLIRQPQRVQRLTVAKKAVNSADGELQSSSF